MYDEICGIDEELDMELKVPRTAGRHQYSNDPVNYFRQSIYIPFIVNVKEDLKSRFAKEVPKSAIKLLNACDEICFPQIHFLLRMLVTLALSTASAERSFSSLKRLKT